MNASSLSGKELDAWMYKHACRSAGKTHSAQQFEEGYAKGAFHFQEDPALVGEMLGLYGVNLHKLGGEWLAFLNSVGCYGLTPSEALCRWVVSTFWSKDVTS